MRFEWAMLFVGMGAGKQKEREWVMVDGVHWDFCL